jgi:hypothetical protein
LAVLTDIQVFGEEKIDFNRSGLTISLILKDLAQAAKHEIQVNIRYKVGEKPGIKYEITSIV